MGEFHTSFSLTVKLLKKQQSQKRMRRHEQHTCSELRHPDRDRQAGRPSPTPRLYDPLQALIDLASLPVPTLGEGDGVATGRQPSNRTLDPYPGYQTNQDSGKEGLRREEGLCIFLYLWQTAVLAWFQLPMEVSTSQPTQNPQDAHGATRSCEQPPVRLGSAGLSRVRLLLVTKHPAWGGGHFIPSKTWSPRSRGQ